MVSQARKRALRRLAAGLLLLPAMTGTGTTLWAQTAPMPAAPMQLRPASDKVTAKAYLKEGRRYLLAGDLATARAYALAADQYLGKWDFWQEDTPKKLLDDIAATPGDDMQPVNATKVARAAGDTPELPPTGSGEAKAGASASKVQFPKDARALVRMGREALEKGNIDLAAECAKRAAAIPTRWGVFEYTPEKLQAAVNSARAEKARREGRQVAAPTAKPQPPVPPKPVAEVAQKTDGQGTPYSQWHVVDPSSDRLAAGGTAKATSIPSASPVASQTKGTSVAGKSVTQDAPKAKASSDQNTPLLPPPAPSPIEAASKPATSDLVPVGGIKSEPSNVSPAKAQAQALLTECRSLEKANKLAAARAKALEAQKLGATFLPEEDSPEKALMDISQKAAGQINSYVDQAMQLVASQPTAENIAQAEVMLQQSRDFAQRMGFDTAGIDAKLAWVKTAARRDSVATAAANHQPNVDESKRAQGQEMLEKARLEMKNGQFEMARQLAEAVFAGGYDLQNEASALLRTIETEQRNRAVAQAHSGYDAGLAALQQGNPAQALAIFRQVDASLLTVDKQKMLREHMDSATAQIAAKNTTPPAEGVRPVRGEPSAMLPPVGAPSADAQAGNARAGSGGKTILPATPMNPAMPGEANNLAAETRALQQIEFQRLRTEGLKVQREAQARFTRGETDAAIQLLTEHLTRLKEAPLDPKDRQTLQQSIEYRLQTFKVLKIQRDAETSFATRQQQKAKQFADKAAEREARFKQTAELMKQYNQLMEEKKYADAEVIALKAQELDPDSDVIATAVNIAKMAKRHANWNKLQKDKEEFALGALNSTEKLGPHLDVDDPVRFNEERARNWRERGNGNLESRRLKSEREREIERKLSTPVTVDFNNVAVREAIAQLSKYLDMNFVLDGVEELKAEGLNPDTPVSLSVKAVPLKSVLNLLLKQAKMTYVIADDVVQIVSEKKARGKLKQVIYPVADLVVPVDNYTMPNALNLVNLLEQHHQRNNQGYNLTAGAFQPQMGLRNGVPAGRLSTVPGSGDAPTIGDVLPPSAMGNGTQNLSMGKNTIEDVLIKLVTNTIQPHTWQDVGGAGTIDYFPIGMALVVNQFEDVQEQIADLLDQLRRLQDVEVAIEVRIVSVSESFFERIGMDFSMNIKTDHATKNFEPQLTTGQFKPAGYLNDPSPRGVIAGITPAGTFTGDLDIPLKSQSFNMAIPTFGGFPNQPGMNGGLSLGLAFLNDIQVFMFMEAAQGDRRFNVMQAPKLTAFNGASANITLSDVQFFVTDLQVFNVNGQLVFRPVNTPFPTNGQFPSISLNLQPVVSADRRYVRINMNPQMYTLSSTIVPLFPVTAFITPTYEGGFLGQPIPFTQYIQQPIFNIMSVQTTVSVPDGGTVVLGGLKTLSEGRNEFGPPILSKIPYLNRLFRNTGYGREAQNTLILVTPRIIINREEAERQVGEPQDFNVPGAGAP
jgi:type II secretory pathway component GspD/PulD (secretin)